MSEIDFNAIMEDVRAANAEGMDFRGKKYTLVATRVEILRRHFGDTVGIVTEPVSIGHTRGEPVIFKASVIATDGRVLGTGHAWEVIGEGNVNRTSALENCETSAIGRALAAMGIHGGEYASANELRDKPENPTSKGLRDAEEDAIMDGLPDDPSEEAIANAYADRIEEKVKSYKTKESVKRYMSSAQVKTWMDRIGRVDDDLRKGVREVALAHMEGLEK